MSEQKHTPGKWEAIPVPDATGAYAIMIGVAPRVAYVHAEPESHANARLIAAAPELLDALRQVIAAATTQGAFTGKSWPQVAEIANAAIFKATGETSPFLGRDR